MITLNSSNKAVALLVADRPHFMENTRRVLFVTISPNPRTQYPTYVKNERGKLVKTKLRYGALKQSEQYQICMGMIRESFLPYMEDPILIGTTELNKEGNVHVHFIISTLNIKDEYDIKILRRQISLERESIRNATRKGIDYMNNIVFLDRPLLELISYLDKDYPRNVRHFPNYFYN